MTDPLHSPGQWALEYARRGGIPVLPLSGKLPRIPKRVGGRGVHDATTDLDQVRHWWRRWPQANIGLRCGIRFDVIDVDGPQEQDSLERFLAEHGQGPIGGPRVLTGSGGWHLYVAPTQLPDHIGVLDHVDYRAAGRYVVAPPSRHPATGRPYTWVVGRGIDTPLGHVPPALLVLLAPRQLERQPRPTIRPATPGHPYGQQALTQETTAVAATAKGTRNHQLWRSARSLYRLVAGGVLEETEVKAPSATPPSGPACSARNRKPPSGPSSPPARSACPSPEGSPPRAVVRSPLAHPDSLRSTTGPPWSTNSSWRPEYRVLHLIRKSSVTGLFHLRLKVDLFQRGG